MAETLVTAEPTSSPASPAAPTASPATTSPVPAAPDWRATLPADLQTHKSLEKFKGPAELAKSYVALESYQGRSVAIPGPDAKPEERAAFYQKLGVPDAPEKYEVKAPEGLGDLDAGAVSAWKQTFHRLNLTPEQVAGLTTEFFGSPMGNPVVAGEALQAQAVTQLRAEWGGAYEHTLRTAQAAIRYADRLSSAGLLPVLEATGLGNHPAVLKHFAWLGRTHAEAGDLPKDVQTGSLLGPAEAKQRIDAIYADKTHPFHRGDRAATDEMQRLFQLVSQAA